MSGLRNPHVYVLLMQRYGWTPSQVDELPDSVLEWMLNVIAAVES